MRDRNNSKAGSAFNRMTFLLSQLPSLVPNDIKLYALAVGLCRSAPFSVQNANRMSLCFFCMMEKLNCRMLPFLIRKNPSRLLKTRPHQRYEMNFAVQCSLRLRFWIKPRSSHLLQSISFSTCDIKINCCLKNFQSSVVTETKIRSHRLSFTQFLFSSAAI